MTQSDFSTETPHETNTEDHFTKSNTHPEQTIHHQEHEHDNNETTHKENVMNNLKNVAAVVFAIIATILLSPDTGSAFSPIKDVTSTNPTFQTRYTASADFITVRTTKNTKESSRFLTPTNFSGTDTFFFSQTSFATAIGGSTKNRRTYVTPTPTFTEMFDDTTTETLYVSATPKVKQIRTGYGTASFQTFFDESVEVTVETTPTPYTPDFF